MDKIKIGHKTFVMPEVYRELNDLKSTKTVYNRISSGKLESINFMGKTLVRLN